MLINSILGIYMLDFKSIFNARQKAQRALKDLVDTINLHNLKYEIKFVENANINIK